jgi:hypothetical protein
MAKINNMQQLRERVLEAMDKLENGEIEIEEAMAVSKMSETVISGLKSEMMYATLTKTQPNIPFYETNKTRLIDHEEIKKIS